MNLALRIVPSLINAVPAGLLAAGTCWLILRYLRGMNAATRYSIWFVALAAVSVMPLTIGRRAAPPPLAAETPFDFTRTQARVEIAVEAMPPLRVEPAPDEPRRAPASLTLDLDFGTALFAGWIAGVVFMGSRLALSAIRTLNLRRGCTPLPENLHTRLPSTAPARLAISADIASPVTIGFRQPVILIPAALVDRISDSDLEHIVLHEMAHVLRGDAWTNLAQRLMEAVMFFHPAVWFIGRRLDLEREIACDDWTVSRTERHKNYAECLTRLIELGAANTRPALASGVLHFPQQISRRIEMILNQKRNRVPTPYKPAVLAGAALAIGAVALCTQATRLVAAEDSKTVRAPKSESAAHKSFRLPDSGGGHRETQISWSSGWDRVSIRARGEVEFTDDDRDIRSLEPDGYLRIEEKSWFLVQRSIEIAAGPSGNLTRTYEVHGDPKEFDGAARNWLSAMLSAAVRETGIGAESRVRRIYKRAGTAGVLDDISRMRSDGVKCVYFRYLFDLTSPDPADLGRILRRVGRDVRSDGDKARLLHEIAEDALASAAPRIAFFEAAQTIGSDGDRSRLLREVLTEGVRPPETLELVLKAAARVNSDGDKARVLVEFTGLHPVDDALRTAFFRAVATIQSDGDRARVLSAAMRESAASKETMAEAVKAAGRIGSDGEKARLLVQAVESYSPDDALRAAFFQAVSTIGSDGERHRVLAALLHRGKLSRETMLDLLRAATRMGSDGEKSRLLVEFTRVCPGDEPLLAAVLDAAASIGSDGEYRRVVSALTERSGGKSVVGKKAKAD
ncbi:MAG: M56 family metallopeptidase [Bryobacterales bacterium]|nr:M56 family metallopeptidase [Bryobacterales bacterium]